MKNGRAVVVSTKHKGIFFGYLNGEDKIDPIPNTLTLKDARMCIYFDSGVKGFMGLSSVGPNPKSCVSPKAPKIMINDITSICFCSDEATKEWEKDHWGNG